MTVTENRQIARLVGLATAVPEYRIGQDDAAEEARRAFGRRFDGYERLSPVFANTGIHNRYSVRPLEWFREPRGWPERTDAYRDGAVGLFREVADRALTAAGLDASEIDTIVTVSSTGIATPSLEAHAIQGLGYREDVRRVPVFGLGCAGGVTGLALAARLAESRPGETVLMVALELCTLSFRLDRLTKANIVATALFGDGAAAAIVRSGADGGLLDLGGSGEQMWPATLDIMGWDVDPVGFGAIFSRSIPDFVIERMRPAAHAFLRSNATESCERPGFVFHPGGARVVDALEEAFELSTGALAQERAVLRDYGNMSAPTVLFVLERALANGMAGTSLMAALGPGFTASFLATNA